MKIGVNIKAFGFDFIYPSEFLEFVCFERTTFLKDFLQVEANKIAEGVIRVGGYGNNPNKIHSPQIFIILVFRIEKEVRSSSIFTIINSVDDIKNSSVKYGMLRGKDRKSNYIIKKD